MAYKVVFDINSASPQLWFPALGLLLVGISTFMWRVRHRPRLIGLLGFPSCARSSARARSAYAGFAVGFSLLWNVFSVCVVRDYVRARRAFRDAVIVEGAVDDFYPMPYGEHDTERFSVNGVEFSYSDYYVTPGFHNSTSHGGPIQPGLLVRIHYQRSDRRILKLEVKQ